MFACLSPQALKEDGWTHEPFQLVEDAQNRLNGRGSTDDKGPILGWLNVIEAHQRLGLELPVNLKMCFEGMEESGSEGLDDLIREEATGYFANVDAVCISDNYWLGTKKPCLTYGLRGINYFHLEIKGPGRDLHSGLFGGAVHEPMTDLIQLFSKLVNPDGKILIPGIYDDVALLTRKIHLFFSTCPKTALWRLSVSSAPSKLTFEIIIAHLRGRVLQVRCPRL